jgi:hypothetical protein
MSMILLEPAYKISRSEIKRRTISVSPIHEHNVTSREIAPATRVSAVILGVVNELSRGARKYVCEHP